MEPLPINSDLRAALLREFDFGLCSPDENGWRTFRGSSPISFVADTLIDLGYLERHPTNPYHLRPLADRTWEQVLELAGTATAMVKPQDSIGDVDAQASMSLGRPIGTVTGQK